jgi:aspartokinase-like uncharacterized kinase
VVLKVGGSLLDWPGLPRALSNLLDTLESDRLVLVAGGGQIVEVLRQLDRIHQVGEERSHELALRAMDLTARVLASILPGAIVVDQIDALGPAWLRGEYPILAPRRFLDADDRTSGSPLPHHWDVTSDSIAARLADRLGASELLLLKSTDTPPGISRQQAADLGLVDPSFPGISRSISRVVMMNLRHPGRPTIRLS